MVVEENLKTYILLSSYTGVESEQNFAEDSGSKLWGLHKSWTSGYPYWTDDWPSHQGPGFEWSPGTSAVLPTTERQIVI